MTTPISWLSIPTPLLRLYKLFPLQSLPPSTLPTRCSPPLHDDSQPSEKSDSVTPHELYIFINPAAALARRPSLNPACLRAQVILALASVPITLISSSNHASPSGSLPFIIPSSDDSEPSTETDILAFANKHGTLTPAETTLAQPYQALIDGPLRHAWLHAVYICPANTPALHHICASSTSTSSPAALATMARQLRTAAATEIETCTRTLPDAHRIYHAADRALDTLAKQLPEDGDAEGVWFFGASQPGVFDAEVFAYTTLILGDLLPWKSQALGDLVRKYPRLIRHCSTMRQIVSPHIVF